MIFGTAPLGSRYSKSASLEILRHAYNGGFRNFDTSPSYGDGQSEIILATFINELPNTSDIFITSKYGLGPKRSSDLYNFLKYIYQLVCKKTSIFDRVAQILKPTPVVLDKSDYDAISQRIKNLQNMFAGANVCLALHDISLHDLRGTNYGELIAKIKFNFPSLLIGYSAVDDHVHQHIGSLFDFVNIGYQDAFQNLSCLPAEIRLFGVSREIDDVQLNVDVLASKERKNIDFIVFSSKASRVSNFIRV